ncbi:MAG TPA: hypothetical protein VFS00_02475, partial [Polyangiaceae bacterium]|nr:hypothetical protein [Polyangiaceae bacterium]
MTRGGGATGAAEVGEARAPAGRLLEADDADGDGDAVLERASRRPDEAAPGEADGAAEPGEGEAPGSWAAGGRRPGRSGGRGSLARRILLLFTLVLIACALTTAWSLYAQRRAAEESTLLRSGYVPLMLSLGAALETQNVVSAQLNHITDAKNPADARGWIETQRRLRPLSFAGVRGAAERGLSRRADRRARALGAEIAAEVGDIERFLGSDDSALGTL